MNLPQLSEASPDWQPYAAVHALPWYGKAAIWRSAALDGFQQITTISRPGYFGTLAFDFYAGPPDRFDMGNELWLDMIAGGFASVTDLQALAGVNTVAVETAADTWEIVGFTTANLQSPNRWKLTRLLRGMLGTEDAIANPVAAGSRVVVLDASVKPVPITGSDYDGLELADWSGGQRSCRSGQYRLCIHAHRARPSSLVALPFDQDGVGQRRCPPWLDAPNPGLCRRELVFDRSPARRGIRGL